ncbi:MAG TPA: nitronate monooxygenase [Amycolatopsis sp.]|nr:nitronate monooxygenase [Amycolatopsis sp.]
MKTALTELAGIRHPIVQTGMGWVAGPRLVSATMTYDELAAAVKEVKSRTSQPFGVNLRADADDAARRVELLVTEEVRVASFALAPKKEKVAGWGADAVIVRGGEGGGHTGGVATTLLLPSVLDAVDIPVVAASGFFDGRGLAAALESAGPVRGLARAARNATKFRKLTGLAWRSLATEGLRMRRGGDRTWSQVLMAANTPMLLRAGLVEGDRSAGVLASGQVVGLLGDLPAVGDLVETIVADATGIPRRLASG